MTTSKLRTQALKFFRDSHGHVVVWQKPNVPITGWLVAKLLAYAITNSSIKHGFALLSTAFLFTWAYQEVTSGASYFRRLLGSLVMLGMLVSFFR